MIIGAAFLVNHLPHQNTPLAFLVKNFYHQITMTDGTGNARDWREALTKDERLEIREIERAIKRLCADLAKLRLARRRIQNRATNREAYAERVRLQDTGT